MRTVHGLIVAGMVGLLAGCATQDYVFGKVGAKEEDFHKDKTACEDEAFTAGNVLTMKYVEARNNCLIKKGWQLQPAKK